MKKILSSIFSVSLLLAPLKILAAEIKNPLSVGTIPELIDKIAGFLFGVSIAIAVIIIVIAGITFVTSNGEPAKVEKAKKMILYTVIGLSIIVLSSGLIAVIRGVLGN